MSKKDETERHEPENDPSNDGDEPTNDRGNGNRQPDYRAAYSEDSLRKKLAAFAATAGKEVVYQVLVLYYCFLDPDTPKKAKGQIVAALGYFIFPADAIPDFIPVVGYSDDLGALALAVASVAMHIKPEHKQRAEEKLKTWFS